LHDCKINSIAEIASSLKPGAFVPICLSKISDIHFIATGVQHSAAGLGALCELLYIVGLSHQIIARISRGVSAVAGPFFSQDYVPPKDV
jgi:hypothetical protein